MYVHLSKANRDNLYPDVWLHWSSSMEPGAIAAARARSMNGTHIQKLE
jgi:hypothetical protein